MGFDWTWHFFWGLEDVIAVFTKPISRVSSAAAGPAVGRRTVARPCHDGTLRRSSGMSREAQAATRFGQISVSMTITADGSIRANSRFTAGSQWRASPSSRSDGWSGPGPGRRW